MSEKDEILELIEKINNYNNKSVLISEYGYFKDKEDRAYRKYAIENMFCGLNRENQDIVIKGMFSLLMEQNDMILARLLKN